MEEKIYLHVARTMENEIMSGTLREGDQVPSTHQVAQAYNINAATAARGVAILSAQGLLEKKRGVGMFVAPGARDAIVERRRQVFRQEVLQNTIHEAVLLGISKRDLIAMIMAGEGN